MSCAAAHLQGAIQTFLETSLVVPLSHTVCSLLETDRKYITSCPAGNRFIQFIHSEFKTGNFVKHVFGGLKAQQAYWFFGECRRSPGHIPVVHVAFRRRRTEPLSAVSCRPRSPPGCPTVELSPAARRDSARVTH